MEDAAAPKELAGADWVAVELFHFMLGLADVEDAANTEDFRVLGASVHTVVCACVRACVRVLGCARALVRVRVCVCVRRVAAGPTLRVSLRAVLSAHAPLPPQDRMALRPTLTENRRVDGMGQGGIATQGSC